VTVAGYMRGAIPEEARVATALACADLHHRLKRLRLHNAFHHARVLALQHGLIISIEPVSVPIHLDQLVLVERLQDARRHLLAIVLVAVALDA
jgi:hypothetical protein